MAIRPLVTITLPSLTVKTIMTQSVTVSINKINQATPNANISAGIAKAKTQGINNPTYNMQATLDPANFSAASYLQYTDLLDLAAHEYTGSNPATLSIYYGKAPSPIILPAFDKTTSGIPVVLSSASIPIDVSNSRDAYQQTISLTFTETR